MIKEQEARLLPPLALQRAAQTPAARNPALPHICLVAMNIYPVLVKSPGIEFAGGAEVQQTIIANALCADGYRVSVLTADHGQADLVDCAGIRIHKLPAAGTRGIKGLRYLYPHMTDVVAGLERIDPDIVYLRVAGFRAAAAAWYARRHGKPFVYACAHDNELLPGAAWSPGLRDTLLFGVALRRADAVLLQNTRQQELLRQRGDTRGLVVPNCFMEPTARSGTFGGHVLWVGSIRPSKCPERFLDLARAMPDKRFVMVGGADKQSESGLGYYQRIQEMAKGVPNLSFIGYVPFDEVGGHYDGASVFVSTSDMEGFPNTFLQAWIRGVPTVSFVSPEVMRGQTGTIVCSDNADMAARVASLTSNNEAWHGASESCRNHFTRIHSVDAVLQSYRELFERLRRERTGRL